MSTNHTRGNETARTDTNAIIAPNPSTAATFSGNRRWLSQLPFGDTRDFENATRGFIGTIDGGIIRTAAGTEVLNLNDYGFLDETDAPDTVHPALWRQARLNRINGLFRVAEGLYQVRGLDIANITFIEADNGLIIVDTLTTTESAAAALALYYRHRPHRQIHTIIYTHSHADHFGGVRGLVSQEQVDKGEVQIIAPAGFLPETVSENVLAGPAMSRRSQFQFGQLLKVGARSTLDAGLGKASKAGTISLIAPTREISDPVETHRIDGVDIVFQLTPETEAPAELHLYLPQWKALNLAENATHTQHNLLPLRGAKVRDAKSWANYLNIALERFGRKAEIVFAQHHWPIWGNDSIVDYLSKQRDSYKFLHDQTLRLANLGYNAAEIAEIITLPDELEQEWSTRGLYGSIKHNAKAIYQRYLGWYDGNPANLDPLPPADSAKKWIEYAGGSSVVIRHATEDYERGEYRWVAEVLSRVVHAEPQNLEAALLLASAFEQLGYQSESATWRNAYLQAAHELRNGIAPAAADLGAGLREALDAGNLFDALAVRLNSRRAAGKRITINWHFTDLDSEHLLSIEHSTLNHLPGHAADKPDAAVTLSQATLRKLLFRERSVPNAIAAGEISIKGNPLKLIELFTLFDQPDNAFPVVTPRHAPEEIPARYSRIGKLASGAVRKIGSAIGKVTAR